MEDSLPYKEEQNEKNSSNPTWLKTGLLIFALIPGSMPTQLIAYIWLLYSEPVDGAEITVSANFTVPLLLVSFVISGVLTYGIFRLLKKFCTSQIKFLLILGISSLLICYAYVHVAKSYRAGQEWRHEGQLDYDYDHPIEKE